MPDVLSQSQIDELLKSMKADQQDTAVGQAQKKASDKDKFNKYDFYSPRKFTKEKIKLLRSIYENYARILTSQINGIFRTMVDVTLLELRESRYYEYENSFHENDCMTIVDTILPEKGKHNVPMMLYVTPGLIITLANHMLGGGDQVIRTEENYRYSDVEMALYKRVIEYIINTMSDGFANYINIEFRAQRVEENPSMVQEVGLDETVVLITLNVDVSGLSSERIRICIPGTLLEQIFRIIDNRKHIARGFSYENNSDLIMNHLRVTNFRMTAQLGTIRLSMEDLMNLQAGDVIDMNQSRNSMATVFVGEKPWFKGRMGIHKKNIAVRIEERIIPENEKGLESGLEMEDGGENTSANSADASAADSSKTGE
ncbi:MAG: FliM/FliN family flagellar motor switch protein [Lachnospiraceae bacterium]|jgi:flagellar motor switch protein FliM|nr:FliM/FliN family flagellar motor switch protein [Lachnospiraceae bacterium]MCH4028480.1 FliM/FliN family flagellar motor switch protein [Lachnospiraceae bacterium]MCH4066330.1 FliM/FliN family flagellar motor switch protein [Lachnospiraceae bacterium]MCH4112360.1 FliM/FliN family flagellar motor switch protein [Lachnospiraceae bacterium]MCI1353339.1 FliM/FliN family flagellar motor switch protein [Lachnospiraceae bacterium]